MLGNEIKLSHGADSESINGQLIWKTEYRRSFGIVSHGNLAVDPLSYQRICAIFCDPEPESAGVTLVVNYVGKCKKTEAFP
jgi:hypothetical protein